MRLITWLLVLFAGALAALVAFDRGLLDTYIDHERIPAEPFARAELLAATGSEDLATRIETALDAGAYDDAVLYADMAAYLDLALPPETVARLDAEASAGAALARGSGQFVEGFVTGEADSTVGLAGAVTSDLTVVGDLRDIGIEGGKLVNGEPYSEIILGLSVAGLAATATTVMTGGSALPARAGISLLKTAKKTGSLTARFTGELRRLMAEAIDFPALQRTLTKTRVDDPAALTRALSNHAEKMKSARIWPVFGDIERLSDRVGPTETIRLLRYVETSDDLRAIGKMSNVFGKRTRAVIELTGKTSLRAFKSLANLILFLGEWIWGVISGIAGLFAIRLAGGYRKRRRGAARAA